MKELCLGLLGLLGGGVLGLLFLMAISTFCISSLFFLPPLCLPRRFFKNFKQRFSLPILSNSWALFSYGAKPTTSLIRALTCIMCLPENFLVGGEANHLSDQSSYVHNVLAREFSRLLLVAGVGGDLVSLIHAHDHLILEAVGGVWSRTRHFQRFSVSCRSESSNISLVVLDIPLF